MSRPYPFTQRDVFSAELFRSRPVSVMLVADNLDEATVPRITRSRRRYRHHDQSQWHCVDWQGTHLIS